MATNVGVFLHLYMVTTTTLYALYITHTMITMPSTITVHLDKPVYSMDYKSPNYLKKIIPFKVTSGHIESHKREIQLYDTYFTKETVKFRVIFTLSLIGSH